MAIFAAQGRGVLRPGGDDVAHRQSHHCRKPARVLDADAPEPRLLRQRHSSEFLARLSTGANSATQVFNLLVTAIGRDFLSLIALVAVMADAGSGDVAVCVRDRAARSVRASQADRGASALAESQFTAARIWRRCRKRSRASASSRPSRSKRNARASKKHRRGREPGQQDGARANRSSPLMESLGGIAIAPASCMAAIAPSK